MKKNLTASESNNRPASGRKASRKAIIGVVCAALVVAIGVITVFAYLSGKSDPVKNKLDADTDPGLTVVETVAPINGFEVKQNVTVNVGKTDYSVYVRAAIVVTWVDKDGNVLADAPVLSSEVDDNGDYILDLNLSTTTLAADQWTFGSSDGFYYYSSPVPSEGSTKALINSAQVKPGASVPEGYTLSVEIVAQTIQAIGTTDEGDVLAVKDAWGVDVDANGFISKRA